MKLILVLVVLVALWFVLRSLMRPRQVALPSLNEQEARAVLGVGVDADADAIRAAHRRLLTGVHPDRGGSDELARRVNAARDVLLKTAR
jgi:DnaJ family protein C protein 19